MRKLRLLAIPLLVFGVGLALAVTFKVSALCPASCDWPPVGRDFEKGYLTGLDANWFKPEGGGALWQVDESPEAYGVDNAEEFIDWMQPWLFDTANGSVNRHAGSAAYVVDTMLGYKGPDFNGNYADGVNTARSRWGDWQQLVRDYDSRGWVQWNTTSFECNYVQGNLDYALNDVFMWQNNLICNSDTMIIFRNPFTNSEYKIKRICGNPAGQTDELSVPPPTQTSCGVLTVTPSQPEIGQPFSISVRPTYASGPPGTTVTNVSLAVLSSPGNIPIKPVTFGGGVINIDSLSSVVINAAGQYSVQWSYKVNELPVKTCGGAFSATDSFSVLAHPYLSVNGGDVLAGTSFSTPTTPCEGVHNTDAGIVSWNNRNSPDYSAAGTDYAAYALNYIQDFGTSRKNPGVGPAGLSFSNVNNTSVAPQTIDLNAGMFGGMFGSISNCVDYWGTRPADAAMTNIPGNNLDIASGITASGDYYWNGGGPGLRIRNGTVPVGVHATIYVTGDVNIDENITYAGSGGWTSLAQIPSLTIVARGSIYIDKDVTNLDGVFVAVPDSSYASPTRPINNLQNPQAGTITTCTGPTGFRGYTAAEIAGDNGLCNKQLTVNGSFVANQVFLLRTFGSAGSNTPAEVFNFGPEAWVFPGTRGSVGNTYDAVIGLPPVL